MAGRDAFISQRWGFYRDQEQKFVEHSYSTPLVFCFVVVLFFSVIVGRHWQNLYSDIKKPTLNSDYFRVAFKHSI